MTSTGNQKATLPSRALVSATERTATSSRETSGFLGFREQQRDGTRLDRALCRMSRLPLLVFVFVFVPFVALFLNGCAGHYHHHHYHRRVVYVRAPGPRPQPSPPPPRQIENPDSPPFDATTARGLLNSIDVSACKDAGTGGEMYGHAKVTFDPDGHITKVVVDEPRGLSPATVSCVGSRLGLVTVQPFRGSSVTMGTTYRL
jgi:hypothetical protein